MTFLHWKDISNTDLFYQNSEKILYVNKNAHYEKNIYLICRPPWGFNIVDSMQKATVENSVKNVLVNIWNVQSKYK